MIQVKVGTNTQRTTVVVSEDTTPKQIFSQQGIDYSRATIHLDGATISTAQMNTSFKDLGCVEEAMLIAVIKTDNATRTLRICISK